MPKIIDSIPVNLASGTLELGPATLPNNFTQFVLRLKRFTTATPQFWADPTTEVTGTLFFSLDGGATWFVACGFGSSGGLVLGRNGVEIPETTVQAAIPRVGGRRGKASITVTNGPLVSEATIELN